MVLTPPLCSGSRKLAPEASAGAIQCGALDLAHHGGAVVVLEQHELDQAVARREQGQPGAAVGAGASRAG